MQYITIENAQGRHILGTKAAEGYAVFHKELPFVAAMEEWLVVPRFAIIRAAQELAQCGRKGSAVKLLVKAADIGLLEAKNIVCGGDLAGYAVEDDHTSFYHCEACRDDLKNYFE